MEGLVEKYFESLFTFTIASYRTTLNNKPATITELMAHTNSIWSRFVFETIQLKSELQEKVEGFILEIITVQIDENLNCFSQVKDSLESEDSEGSEDFEKG